MERSESQGRAILKCAVNAIQDERWDDLSELVEINAPAIQSARLRLEQQQPEIVGKRVLKSEFTIPDDAVTSDQSWKEPAVNWVITVSRWADFAPLCSMIAVQVLVLASYLPALSCAGFTMDDAVAVEKNPCVVGADTSIKELLRRDYWGLPLYGSGWTNKSFRPITTLTFRWNFLLHGLDSSGFHITNVLLHCLASVMVGCTARQTLGLSGAWAAITALFFGVHPIHTENVLYLVGRADILATIFGLAALNMYSVCFCPPPVLQFSSPETESRRDPGYVCSAFQLVPIIALVAASGLCKESGFTFFALLALVELLNFLHAPVPDKGEQEGWRRRRSTWRYLRFRSALLVTATVMIFVARYRQTAGTELNMSQQDNPISFILSKQVRVLSYAFLQGVYAKLLCWPQFLCYDYSMDAIPAVQIIGDCRLLLPLSAYIGFVASCALALSARSDYRRAALLALALLLVTYFPASNVLFPVGTVIGERLLYIPSIGFCGVIIIALHHAFVGAMARCCMHNDANSETGPASALCGNRSGQSVSHDRPRKRSREHSRERLHHTTYRASPEQVVENTSNSVRLVASADIRLIGVGSIFILVLLAGLAVRTFFRAGDWSSSDTLFFHDGHAQPNSAKTQFNLAIMHMQRNEWDGAVSAFVRCAWADPLSSLPFYRIGQIEIIRGNFQSAESWLSAALDKFGASLMVPDEEVFHDLALAMFHNGKVDHAERRLQLALRINPEFAKGWNNFACCIAMRDLHDAVRASRQAVALSPYNPTYLANLALLARHGRDLSTANAAWQRAVEIFPSIPEPRDCTWEFAPS